MAENLYFTKPTNSDIQETYSWYWTSFYSYIQGL